METRDDHTQQLNNDACGNVRHHAQCEDRQLQQGATAKEVNDVIDSVVTAIIGDTLLNGAVGNTGGRDESAHAVYHDHAQGKQQLASQVGGL